MPRAKAKYSPRQLLFKSSISSTVKNLNRKWQRKYIHKKFFIDGTSYITRHKDTRTTHLPLNTPNYINEGNSPYPGITKDTCHISSGVRDKHILLIDDIYTKNVNIDEDAIQALLDKGAKSVIFYAVGKTVEKT